MKFDDRLIWEQTHPVDWLRMEYSLRRSKNPSYSLRAFAKFLDVPSGPLSEILAKKRKLSRKLGEQLSARLGYTEKEKDRFLELVSRNERPQQAWTPGNDADGYRQLEIDQFAIISDWYHFALLSLLETNDVKHDDKWFAQRLGISLTELRAALERMERMGMIQKVNGQWMGTGQWCNERPSLAGRNFLRQGLEQAIHALEHIPNGERDHTSMTMAIDPSKLPMAIKMIEKFRRGMAKFLEEGSKKEVYKLNVQLFPISKKVQETT